MKYAVDDILSKKLSQLDRAYRLKHDDDFFIALTETDPQTLELIRNITLNKNNYHGFLRYLSEKAASDPDFSIDAARNVLNGIYQISKRLSYSRLSADLGSNLSANMHLNSMAFKNKEEYSEIGHVHDYNHVKIQSPINKNGIRIAELSVGNSSGIISVQPIYMPEYKQPEYQLNDIGDMKMVAAPRTQIPYTSQDFDGWVYADGSIYPKNIFPAAYELFKNQPNSTLDKFAVPKIQHFVKAYIGKSGTAPYMSVDWENALIEHTHSNINTATLGNQAFNNIPISLKFNYFNMNYTSSGDKSLHTGYTGKYNGKIDYKIEATGTDMKTLSAYTKDMTTNETESYPDYIMIQTMIYIGVPRHD